MDNESTLVEIAQLSYRLSMLERGKVRLYQRTYFLQFTKKGGSVKEDHIPRNLLKTSISAAGSSAGSWGKEKLKKSLPSATFASGEPFGMRVDLSFRIRRGNKCM